MTPRALAGSRSISPTTWGLPHPEPLLGLVLALQAQHDDIGVHGRDLQLVLLLSHLLLLVDDAAAQQVHVQLGVVVLGGFVTLEGERQDVALQGCWALPGPAEERLLGMAGPTDSWVLLNRTKGPDTLVPVENCDLKYLQLGVGVRPGGLSPTPASLLLSGLSQG